MKKKFKSSLQPIFIDLLARSSTMISENKIVSPVINLEQLGLICWKMILSTISIKVTFLSSNWIKKIVALKSCVYKIILSNPDSKGTTRFNVYFLVIQ